MLLNLEKYSYLKKCKLDLGLICIQINYIYVVSKLADFSEQEFCCCFAWKQIKA